MTIGSMYADIAEFHARFGLEARENGKLLPLDFLRMRLKRQLEEVDELAKALAKRDLTQVTDALVDIVYIALGNAWLLNVPFELAWEEVHQANMRKERAHNKRVSKYGSIYDIIKPPNLSQFITPEDLALKVPAPAKTEQHDLIDYLNELKGHQDHEQTTRGDTA